jgi:excisionase family DNA binding protein
MKYYSTEEIAEMYNLKPVTIRNWITKGQLKAIKLGHLWRISETDLQEFVKQDKKESAQRIYNQWVEDGKNEG